MNQKLPCPSGSRKPRRGNTTWRNDHKLNNISHAIRQAGCYVYRGRITSFWLVVGIGDNSTRANLTLRLSLGLAGRNKAKGILGGQNSI